MKKWVIALIMAALVSGCSEEGQIGEAAKSGDDTGIGEHQLSDIGLKEKKFISHKLAFKDPRDEQVVDTIHAKEVLDGQNVEQFAEEMEEKFDKPMIPARLAPDGRMIPGQSRVVFDKKKLIEQLGNIKAFQTEVKLPITETAPNVTAEALQNIDKSVLASYKTTFNPTVAGRTTNIELSANEINQIILGPGDRFYYNLIIGETTLEKGYQKAMEIVNKELVEGIGGGICQTSSTLYNAIDKAGLGVLELHHHSKQVGYVPKDRDATVSYGGKDFKFMNTKDYPVMIKTILDKKAGSLEVQVTTAPKFIAKK